LALSCRKESSCRPATQQPVLSGRGEQNTPQAVKYHKKNNHFTGKAKCQYHTSAMIFCILPRMDYICNNEIFDCVDSIYLFDKTDKDNIKFFLSMLGKTDFNGQIMNCKLYKKYFLDKLKLLEENENNKCKSISTIIAGIGLFITIIIA
jgi:hypothetical protein